MPRRLVVKVTCGAEAPERCNQALTVAATAGRRGRAVGVAHRRGRLARGARPGRPRPAPRHPRRRPRRRRADGGSLTVCSQCAARRDLTEADLLPGTPSPVRLLRRPGARGRRAGARLLTPRRSRRPFTAVTRPSRQRQPSRMRASAGVIGRRWASSPIATARSTSWALLLENLGGGTGLHG